MLFEQKYSKKTMLKYYKLCKVGFCREEIMKKRLFVSVVFFIMLAFTACSSVDKSALHINHGADENYGKGDYVYSTVLFSGSMLDEDHVYSVRELEELAQENEALAYEGKYSMLTRGSVFSTHEMTGVKLYEMLLKAGLDEDADDNTDVKLISADGYMSVMSLGEIRESRDNTYESMDNEQPVAENVPVILAFGSDGVPLTGPVGSAKPGEEVPESEGFDEKAENVGGPVRLIAGQRSSDEYNAPDNAKWIRKVVVGDATDRDKHSGEKAQEECLVVEVKSDSGDEVSQKTFTYSDIESFKETEENYYGKKGYYKGVDLWRFLASSVEFSSREGTVRLYYKDGTEEELDMAYFRNIKGDYDKYITEKDGLEITNVKPALGYCADCTPSEEGIYALLPEAEGYRESSTAKPVEKIELILDGESALSENPYGSEKISLKGSGLKSETDITVNELEAYLDLRVTDGNDMGISLAGLLEDKGLTVDAEKVTIKGSSGKVSYTYSELKKNRDSILLITRENGKTPESGGPVKLGDVEDVREIIVDAGEGKWEHSEKPYSQYLKTTLTISGSEAADTKTYTLEELEAMDQITVRDSFGASNGIKGYQGVILRELIMENLKEGIDKPSKITVIGKDGYETKLSVDDVMNGIDSKYQQGEHRDIIIAYSMDGVPLVKNKKSDGFTGENGFGPMRLVVENQVSKWVKGVKEIKIGE